MTNTLYKMVNPLLLFFFSVVVSENSLKHLSIVEILLLGLGLFLVTEIRLLLTQKECYLFGWEKQENKGHLVFGKSMAIKRIMFAVCAIVAVQNMLFVIPGIGRKANSTMLMTLVIGGWIMWMYKGKKNKPIMK